MARATWLADVLRAAGLTVREDPGWKTRGRDDFNPAGVIVHATAGGRLQSNDSAYNVLVNGRVGLAGPISTVMIERGTGVWRPVASGASNHAKIGWAGNCKDLGNRNLIGIEAHHDNLSEPWTEAALDNYARGVAAICRRLGVGVNRVSLHKEHQPGEKTDTTFDGNAFRARVARHLATANGGNDVGTWDDPITLAVPATEAGLTDPPSRYAGRSVSAPAGALFSFAVLRIASMHERQQRIEAALSASAVREQAAAGALAASAQREQDMLAAIGALAATGGGSVDAAAIIARIEQRSADVTGLIERQAAEIEELQRAIAERDARIAAAYAGS